MAIRDEIKFIVENIHKFSEPEYGEDDEEIISCGNVRIILDPGSAEIYVDGEVFYLSREEADLIYGAFLEETLKTYRNNLLRPIPGIRLDG